MKKIFELLLKANTSKQVTDVLEKLIDAEDVKWLPVGGKKDNIATINIGTDPAAGLTERITNAIDAVLEMEWNKQGKPKDIKNPRTAVEQWFGTPQGKLKNIVNASDKSVQDLSRRIKVTLKDSEKESFPTMEIRDSGIGLKSEQFSRTILSLHGENKLDKLYLMGAYGQGGSTALSFSNFTIVISKSSLKEKGVKQLVAFTVVRINLGNVDLDKHPWYEYCVDGKNGQPFTLDVDDDKFHPGTLVRHIGMELGKYTSKMTGPTSSLWYLVHHNMFDPIFPFTISGERQKDLNKGKIENRSVLGNNRRLTRGGGDEKELTQYSREATLTFKDGKVVIYYWVLTIEGDKPWDRIKNYVLPSQPIVITFNGQKQGYLPNSIIKSDLKLPFLEKYLVVQIECDHLDNESKRQLFSTTRESLRDTSILEELRRTTIDTLDADDELKRLDKERRDRYLKKDETEVLDKLRKRLASRINSFLKVASGGKGVKATDTGETVKPKKLPPIPVNDPPTFIEITTPKKKEVYIGKTFSIKFKTDAHPNLFNNPDWFLAVIEPHSFGSYTGSARVVDGYGIAYFKARETIEDGVKARITLELRPPRQKTLSDSVSVVATVFPDDTDSKKSGNKGTPNIEVIAIGESDAYYKEHNWNYDTVAEVADDQDTVYIYINDSNRQLTKLIERAQQYSTQAVESVKNRYREHVGFCSFMISKNKVEDRLQSDDGKVISIDQVEQIKKADLENACETVCGMITDFFDYVRIETKED
ncbi:MAG TPA: hypothetical protein VK508_12150 [Cyclobacteriaceae bacterium]|nr:hypothetical protein [Cyclobacteriaceae bacterium]